MQTKKYPHRFLSRSEQRGALNLLIRALIPLVLVQGTFTLQTAPPHPKIERSRVRVHPNPASGGRRAPLTNDLNC